MRTIRIASQAGITQGIVDTNHRAFIGAHTVAYAPIGVHSRVIKGNLAGSVFPDPGAFRVFAKRFINRKSELRLGALNKKQKAAHSNDFFKHLGWDFFHKLVWVGISFTSRDTVQFVINLFY
jgi:hypothetical protein